jgi:hypothetical protein
MAKIFSYYSGFMQTITGRRQPLRAALETLVAENGWREIRRDVYSKAYPRLVSRIGKCGRKPR